MSKLAVSSRAVGELRVRLWECSSESSKTIAQVTAQAVMESRWWPLLERVQEWGLHPEIKLKVRVGYGNSQENLHLLLRPTENKPDESYTVIKFY